ncbi:H-2 class I histocompatibility antigen, alpha chain-like isoform X2 [Phyllobates terribilis]|uniref:H-2 class I histocompatibility antigen, alpha chain-like isoform X2 n=1 Tax=Phyllobates terribilis TaxID=111132 RepID=UPI003CCAB548
MGSLWMILAWSSLTICKGDHSHYFFDTATTDLTSNMTSYTMSRTLDDVTLMWYDSNDEVVERRVPWYKSPYETLLDASKEFYSSQIDMINILHDYIHYSNHTEEVPVVKVTQIPVDNSTFRVHCRAYGHYPKDISIMWYKNGQQISEEMMERMTLPLLDLTYLTSLSFNVTSVPDDVYTCRVNHSSMLRDFTQDWRIPSDSEDLSSASPSLPIWAVIAICLVAILIIAAIIFGSVSFLLKRTQLHEPFE